MPTFRSQLLHALAAAAGTVAAALIGSFFGTTGTLIGLALGASIATVATYLAEQALTRAHQAAVSREWFTRQRGRPPTPAEETQIHSAVRAVTRRRGVPWKRLGLFAGGVAVAGLAAITVIEVGAGKPVADVVTGHPGHGTTISGPVHAYRHHRAPHRSRVEPSVAPTRKDTPQPATTTPTASPTPSAQAPTTPAPVPSPTPAAATTVPTATTSGIP